MKMVFEAPEKALSLLDIGEDRAVPFGNGRGEHDTLQAIFM